MYLIDAYNLLHAIWKADGDFPRDFGVARRWMVDLIDDIVRSEGLSATVFFDGRPGTGDTLARPNLRIIFSDTHEEADDQIRDAIAHGLGGKHARVVSSDNEIRRAARYEGLRSIRSEVFAARILKIADRRMLPRHGRHHHVDAPPQPSRQDPQLDAASIDALQNKPKRGGVGDLEEAMLAEIGDFQELAREALSEELPARKKSKLMKRIKQGAKKKRRR